MAKGKRRRAGRTARAAGVANAIEEQDHITTDISVDSGASDTVFTTFFSNAAATTLTAEILTHEELAEPVRNTSRRKTQLVIAMAENYDAWVAHEYIIEVLNDIRKKLRVGSVGAGATLTLSADECMKGLACLRNPPQPNSRPPQDWFAKQATIASIARYCLGLEEGGVALKNAVADTAKHFGCSTSKVYASRTAPRFPYK